MWRSPGPEACHSTEKLPRIPRAAARTSARSSAPPKASSATASRAWWPAASSAGTSTAASSARRRVHRRSARIRGPESHRRPDRHRDGSRSQEPRENEESRPRIGHRPQGRRVRLRASWIGQVEGAIGQEAAAVLADWQEEFLKGESSVKVGVENPVGVQEAGSRKQEAGRGTTSARI